MTEFKAGDKVRVLKTHWKGKEVEVISTANSIWPYRVRSAEGETGAFHASELELVKPEQKFKVGDWVEVTGWKGPWEGQVTTVESFDGKYYRLASGGGFSEKYLKASAAPLPTKPKFNEGDIVKVAPGGFSYNRLKGKTLTIDAYNVVGNPDFPYKVRGVGESYIPGHDFREDELELVPPVAKFDFVVDKELATVKGTLWHNGEDKPVDLVNDPSHYGGKDNPYEVIKVAEAWGLNENAYLFNALKYLGRAGKKGSKVEDLKKLTYYVNREIALEEAK